MRQPALLVLLSWWLMWVADAKNLPALSPQASKPNRNAQMRPLRIQTATGSNFQQISMCQLPGHLLPLTKCRADQDGDFKRAALADFQMRLDESSSELSGLISSYWQEFSRLTMDLVQVAKEGTLSRLRLGRVQDEWQRNQHELAIRRLFEAMQKFVADASSERPLELGAELSLFFRRLTLVQLKQNLDQRLVAAGHEQREVDLECLGGNLASEESLDRLLAGLQLSLSASSQAAQLKLGQSIRKSLEFARTLLSSLSFTNEMFHNLTQRATEWMPQASCHQALARMSVCPQCYPNERMRAGLPVCEPFCLNVVRGCMNDVYELDRFWSDHVRSLASFKTNMIQMNNIENVMLTLDDKLTELVAGMQLQPAGNNAVRNNGTTSKLGSPSSNLNSNTNVNSNPNSNSNVNANANANESQQDTSEQLAVNGQLSILEVSLVRAGEVFAECTCILVGGWRDS